MNTEIPANILPIIIPLIIVQLGLAIFAITRIVKQPSFKYGNKITWILVSLFINLIGPILYFTIGKEEQQ